MCFEISPSSCGMVDQEVVPCVVKTYGADGLEELVIGSEYIIVIICCWFKKTCDLISVVFLLVHQRFSVEVGCPSANNSCNQDMDSSSSSMSSFSSTSPSRSESQEGSDMDGLQQSKADDHPLFFIKPIDSQGQGIEKKKRLEDLGEYYNHLCI